MSLILPIFVFLYIIIAPGALMTKMFLPAQNIFPFCILSVSLGLAIIPVFAFGIAMLFHTVISLPLLLGISTGFIVVNTALLLLFKRMTN